MFAVFGFVLIHTVTPAWIQVMLIGFIGFQTKLTDLAEFAQISLWRKQRLELRERQARTVKSMLQNVELFTNET